MRRLLTLAPLLVVAACGGADVTIGSDDTPAKATPEALVAVALSHLTPEPDDIELYRADEPVDDSGTLSPWIGGLLRWKPDPDWTLSLRVQPSPEEPHLCDVDRTCAALDEARISWQPAGEDQPGYVTVYAERDGELRSIGYEGGFEGDPRDDDLAVDLHELADIVTDPAFSLTTTQAAVDAGAKLLPDLPETKARERARAKWEAAPQATPRSLAALVERNLRQVGGMKDVVASARADVFREPGGTPPGAVGVEVTLRDGVRIHVSVWPEPSAALRACPPTLHCESWDPGKTFAWRADLAGSVRSDEQRSVHVWVDGPPIKAATKDWLFPGGEPKPAQVEASAALANLPDDLDMGWKTTDKLIAAGDARTWFHD